MFHPSRGGSRGGTDQFEWESVKSDKHRENYLGHSLMAPVGRWQKGKDLQWFSRDPKSGMSRTKEQEKEAIKIMEAEAMAAALGRGPVKKQASGLTKQEVMEVCKKGQSERDDMDIERVEGMGFASSRASLIGSMTSSSGVAKDTLQGHTTTEQTSRKDKRQDRERDGDAVKNKKKKKKEKRKRKRRKKSDESSSSDEGHGGRDDIAKQRKHRDGDHRQHDKEQRGGTRDRRDRDKPDRTSESRYHGNRKRHDSVSSEDEKHSRRLTSRNDRRHRHGNRRRHDSSSSEDDSRRSAKDAKVSKSVKTSHVTSRRRDSGPRNEQEIRRRRHDSSSD